MHREGFAEPARGGGRARIAPALACAAICVALTRMGLLSPFFLVPLGVAAAAFGPLAAWRALALAAIGHAALMAAAFPGGGLGIGAAGAEMLRFSALAAGFTWVMAGNPPAFAALLGRADGSGPGPEEPRLAEPGAVGPAGPAAWALPRVRALYRFAVASAVPAFALAGAALGRGGDGGGFYAAAARIEPILSAYIAAAAGGDAVRQAVLEHALAPERLAEAASAVALRGGALFAAAFLLFFSRQAAFALAGLARRGRAGAGALAGFFAPRGAIWVFSLSVPAILLGRAVSAPAIEIAAWNALVMCALAFLAQGAGIALFFLARRPPPLRLLLGALAVFAALSPGLNLFALAALAAVGIAENWLPLRKARRDA